MNRPCYLCVDLKRYFASAECAARGLDPFKTNLVVADNSRGKGALCLAVTPALSEHGVKNRCRLYEIPDGIEYIIAKADTYGNDRQPNKRASRKGNVH